MTNKVDIKRLDSITKNDTTATEQINTNFKALQEAIENTLSRDGTGPNFMDADLDMNSYRIINSADPAEDNDIVNLKYVEERIGGAVEASKTAVSAATQAANSAQSALVSSTNAINALRNAENTINQATTLLTETQEYVDAAKADIDDTVEAGKQEINTTIDDAQMSLSDTIQQSVEDVKQQALDAAQESIDTAAEQATTIVIDHAENVIKPELNALATAADEDAKAAENWAKTSRVWATGEDAEVEEFAPGENEHSSRGYADLAMAIANTPENVPVDASTLLALDVIRGPKGDSGEADFSGDINFTGTFKVNSDSNHPVSIYGMAGTSATGYQIEDTLGAGESDFEHYATGDRYGTRITNHNNKSGTSVNIDLYQSNAGRSVLDTTDVETVLIPTADAGDSSQKAANTEWVDNEIETRTLKTSQITNCITEIPQDIKLELNNGTLTLKAGSKVYVPNGFEADGTTPKFDVVVVESDASINNRTTNTKEMLFYSIDTQVVNLLWLSDISSGTTQPTGHQYMIWYDTANNLCKFTKDSGVTWEKYSLPVSLVAVSSTQITSIDQVFNGFGYIGSTVFALPGVKGLIPNGRNADGSLRNIEFVVDNVWLGQTAYNTNKATLGVISDMKALVYVTDKNVVYDESCNKNKQVSNGNYWQGCFAGGVSVSDMKFTSFNPKQPFHAVDRNDSSWVSAQAMPSTKRIALTLGASGTTYTAPASGYIAVGIDGVANNWITFDQGSGYFQTTFTSPNKDTNWVRGVYAIGKGDNVNVYYSSTSSSYSKYIYFYYAEGDK